MKNTMKTLMLGVAMVLPAAVFAEEVKSAAPQPEIKAEQKVQPSVSVEKPLAVSEQATAVAKEHKDKHMFTLLGAKEANTADLVKLAKEAGAKKASFNAKDNILTVQGGKFDKEKFTSSLSTLPGVSVKN